MSFVTAANLQFLVAFLRKWPWSSAGTPKRLARECHRDAGRLRFARLEPHLRKISFPRNLYFVWGYRRTCSLDADASNSRLQILRHYISASKDPAGREPPSYVAEIEIRLYADSCAQSSPASYPCSGSDPLLRCVSDLRRRPSLAKSELHELSILGMRGQI